MSRENVKLFFEALGRDEALQAGFAAANQEYQRPKSGEVPKDLIFQKKLLKLAEEAGFNFILAEPEDYARKMPNPNVRQLSNEEMAAVAGGTSGSGGSLHCSCAVTGGGVAGELVLCNPETNNLTRFLKWKD